MLLGMARVNFRRLDAHGAIDMHRDRRNLAFVFHLANGVYQLLGSADGECRNEKTATLRRGLSDHVTQLSFRFLRMHTIAVGRLDEQPIRALDRLRVLQYRPVITTQVARIENGSLPAV